MAEYDAVIVGSGVNSLACAALLARGGWRVCVLERNDWFGGAIKTEELTEPGFLARHVQRVAPALGRRRRARRARRRARRARARVPQHRAADGDGVPGRRRGLSAPHGGGKRAGARAGVAGRARALPPERRPRLRVLGTELLVAGRPRVRREGGAASRPCRRGRLPRRRAPVESRLARDDVRLGARPRPARAVGAAHRPRARPGDVRLHDAGDRRRGAGGRDAGARAAAVRSSPRRSCS